MLFQIYITYKNTYAVSDTPYWNFQCDDFDRFYVCQRFQEKSYAFSFHYCNSITIKIQIFLSLLLLPQPRNHCNWVKYKVGSMQARKHNILPNRNYTTKLLL